MSIPRALQKLFQTIPKAEAEVTRGTRPCFNQGAHDHLRSNGKQQEAIAGNGRGRGRKSNGKQQEAIASNRRGRGRKGHDLALIKVHRTI